MSKHWDKYWEEGHITSFGTHFTNNYSGVYRDYWVKAFESIADDSHLLDIATGNAAIPLLLLESAKQSNKRVTIAATDLAKVKSVQELHDLHPQLEVDWGNLNIYPNVNSSELPFDSNSFDLITSQYGFEYSAFCPTVKEISRVAKCDALIHLFIHHSDSIILQRNNATLDCLNYLLTNRTALDLLSKLVEGMGEISNKGCLEKLKHNKQVEQNREELNVQIQSLVDNYQNSFLDSGFTHFVKAMFSKFLMAPVKEKLSLIKSFEQELGQDMSRLIDLRDAAYNENRIDELTVYAEKQCLNLQSKNVIKDATGKILGWSVVMVKKK